MIRKNKNFIVESQPVVMALTLNRQTQRERIIIGPKQDVQRHMEGKQTQEDLFDRERPLGQLVFDLENEIVGEWNDTAIFELKSALHSRLGRKKYESNAKGFLKQKLASDNAVSIFWARNFLNAYERCKKKVPRQNAADMFEGQAMMLTRLGKNNILPKTGDYAVEDVIERVQVLMRAGGYRQDASVQILYPWRRCEEEFVMIENSVLAGILFYLNRLMEWRVCFRVCDVCGKCFVATSAHHSLCSDACRKEQNRLNKQEFDKRAQKNGYDRDYSGSTRRMRDLIKRKSKGASPEVCVAAELFYDRFRDEAKSRKKTIKAKQDEIVFRDWLFEQERILDNLYITDTYKEGEN